MSDTWTRDEIFSKLDWEGGTWEGICGYGISEEVLPKDAPAEVREAWKRVRASRADVYIIDQWLEGASCADPEIIRDWWDADPEFNVGICTGPIPRTTK